MKKRLTLQDKAVIALKEAVKEVVEQSRKNQYPLAVWKDGKVVQIQPKKRK